MIVHIAGEKFTAVDGFYCPIAFRVQTYASPLSVAWYQAASKEPLIEPAHDADVLAFGSLMKTFEPLLGNL